MVCDDNLSSIQVNAEAHFFATHMSACDRVRCAFPVMQLGAVRPTQSDSRHIFNALPTMLVGSFVAKAMVPSLRLKLCPAAKLTSREHHLRWVQWGGEPRAGNPDPNAEI